MHDVHATGETYTVMRIDGKKIKQATIHHLIEKGNLFPHSRYLCSSCRDVAENEIKSSAKKQVTIIDYFEEFLEAITSKKFADEQLDSIAFAVARAISDDVFEDSVTIGKAYKNHQFLQTMTAQGYTAPRNSTVVAFLKGLNPDSCETSDKKALNMAAAVEHIYYFRNPNIVAPFCFSKNLLGYYMTGSKNACMVNSSGSPSGSYTTMQKWITSQTTEPLQCPDEDVVTFFDNNQVLGRKWHVENNFKSKVSVITTVLHVVPNRTQKLQWRDKLSPQKWLSFTTEAKTTAIHKIVQQDAHFDDIFRYYRNNFINDLLQSVATQQKPYSHSSFRDHVDEDQPSETQTPANERYCFVPNLHPKKLTEVLMGEPCFENPCSFESVEKVFNHVQEFAFTSGRKWTILGCDGLPFTLGGKIIEHYYECSGCRREFDGVEHLSQHISSSGHAFSSLNENRKYKNIVLLPGLGHYEINIIKAVFKLLWEPLISQLARQLGFISPKALASCQNASDHHKSWQIIQIVLFSTADELLVPYCRQEMECGNVPSLEGYYKFLREVKNPNYTFLVDAIFTVCFTAHLFRAGVRRNNFEAVYCSLNKLSNLFFILNMPLYCETYARDRIMRAQCPAEFQQYLQDHVSFSTSGCPSKVEGGDFVLENRNRKIKMCLPPGLPSDSAWLNVCRNIDRLDKICENVSTICGIVTEDPEYIYAHKYSKEIQAFRRKIRQEKYLHDARAFHPHKTLSGNFLDTGLVSFMELSIQNKVHFWETIKTKQINTRPDLQTLKILDTSKDKSA